MGEAKRSGCAELADLQRCSAIPGAKMQNKPGQMPEGLMEIDREEMVKLDEASDAVTES